MRNLEKEKEAYRRDLEDALENNHELKSLNTALRDDMQSAKAKFEKMQQSYKRSSTSEQIKRDSPSKNINESLEVRIKDLEDDVKILEQELNQKMDHIDAQNSAYDALQRELEELQITNGLL